MPKDAVRSNRDIDSFIVHGEFEIELNWAYAQLTDYLHELEILDRGADYKELGIGQRRAASMPSVITFQGSVPSVVNDPAMLPLASVTPPGSFALLRLQGVMRSQDGASSRGITSLITDLQNAWMNSNIDGILIDANTGGGESLAGQILKGALEESPKPVVVWAHMLASAGIHGTLPATEIIASGESAQFGSIGTFISIDRRFAQWYNSAVEDIYADKSTNKNKEFREFLKGNKEPLTRMLNRSNDYFLREVQRWRQLKGDVEHTLSGELFYAREAKSRGLIDGIGSFQYAIQRLSAHARRRKKAT